MRKFGLLLFTLFVALWMPSTSRGQTSTTFTITVQAPPSCTVTLAANPVSTSGSQLYANQAGTINFNISACPSASSAATATWDGTSITTTYVPAAGAVLAKLSTSVTAAQATAGTHTLILTIPLPTLSMSSPVTLPNGKVGQAYSANLSALSKLAGGVPPYVFTLTTGNLPSGLSLSSSGMVTGTPSSGGPFNFGFTVSDSSGLAVRLRSIPAGVSAGG